MKNAKNIPAEYKPISVWGYFGYSLLFSIPVVGFIMLFIFAIGSKNINKRNYARSYFCYLFVIFIIICVTIVITGFTGGFTALAEFFQNAK